MKPPSQVCGWPHTLRLFMFKNIISFSYGYRVHMKFSWRSCFMIPQILVLFTISNSSGIIIIDKRILQKRTDLLANSINSFFKKSSYQHVYQKIRPNCLPCLPRSTTPYSTPCFSSSQIFRRQLDHKTAVLISPSRNYVCKIVMF